MSLLLAAPNRDHQQTPFAPMPKPRQPTALAGLTTLFLLAPLTTSCRKGEDAAFHRLSGRLESPLVDLAPKVPGRVLEVLAKEGDRVKAGDVLVRLDLGEARLSVQRDLHGVRSAKARLDDLATGSRRAEIAQAEAELSDRRAAVTLTRRELARQETLNARKVGAARDLDRARTEVDRAEAALKVAEERLVLVREGFRKGQTEQARSDLNRAETVLKQSETVAQEAELRSPADAIVLHRLAEPGQLLGTGQPGLTLAFLNRLYVRTFIPERLFGRIRSGDRAEIVVDAYPGKRFPGRVTDIANVAEFTPKPVDTARERVNLVFAAKVDLDGGWKDRLHPGQPADVLIPISGSSESSEIPPAPSPGAR